MRNWGELRGLERLTGLHVLESSGVDRAHVVYVSRGLGDVKSWLDPVPELATPPTARVFLTPLRHNSQG